tara:strand:+ start:720 stop:1340 length:621 start_codon:yes stop_codon:yes gene_type:complete
MKSRFPYFRWLALIVLITTAGFSTAFAKEDAPEIAVKNLLDNIKKIKTGDPISSKHKKTNHELSIKALTFLDLEEVGRKSLGKYWKNLSMEDQKEFVALLSQLFKKIAFPNSSRFFEGLDIKHRKSKLKKDIATAIIIVTHEKEGEVEIDFVLSKSSGKWKVIEVILDGVSMRNNLRSQFYKIIAQNGYAELARRMSEKLKKQDDQ